MMANHKMKGIVKWRGLKIQGPLYSVRKRLASVHYVNTCTLNSLMFAGDLFGDFREHL